MLTVPAPAREPIVLEAVHTSSATELTVNALPVGMAPLPNAATSEVPLIVVPPVQLLLVERSWSPSSSPVFDSVSGPVPVIAPVKWRPSVAAVSENVVEPFSVTPGKRSFPVLFQLSVTVLGQAGKAPPQPSTMGPPLTMALPVEPTDVIVMECSCTLAPRL